MEKWWRGKLATIYPTKMYLNLKTKTHLRGLTPAATALCKATVSLLLLLECYLLTYPMMQKQGKQRMKYKNTKIIGEICELIYPFTPYSLLPGIIKSFSYRLYFL